MPKPLMVSIPHHLGKAEALRRIKEGVAYLKTTQANRISILQEDWTDDQVAFRIGTLGQTASGVIGVTEDHVTCSLELPWMLAMLADKARGLIEKEGTLLLDKK